MMRRAAFCDGRPRKPRRTTIPAPPHQNAPAAPSPSFKSELYEAESGSIFSGDRPSSDFGSAFQPFPLTPPRIPQKLPPQTHLRTCDKGVRAYARNGVAVPKKPLGVPLGAECRQGVAVKQGVERIRTTLACAHKTHESRHFRADAARTIRGAGGAAVVVLCLRLHEGPGAQQRPRLREHLARRAGGDACGRQG